MYIYIYIYMYLLYAGLQIPVRIGQEWPNSLGTSARIVNRGRVLLTEILLPRIARQGAVCLLPKI